MADGMLGGVVGVETVGEEPEGFTEQQEEEEEDVTKVNHQQHHMMSNLIHTCRP